jgi:hypothetical protein
MLPPWSFSLTRHNELSQYRLKVHRKDMQQLNIDICVCVHLMHGRDIAPLTCVCVCVGVDYGCV